MIKEVKGIQSFFFVWLWVLRVDKRLKVMYSILDGSHAGYAIIAWVFVADLHFIFYFGVSQSIRGVWLLLPCNHLLLWWTQSHEMQDVALLSGSPHAFCCCYCCLCRPDAHFPVFCWHCESYIWHLHSLEEWSDCDGTLLDICLRTANVGVLDDDAGWGLARICINCLNSDALNSSKVFETQHKLPMSEQESKTHPSRQHY